MIETIAKLLLALRGGGTPYGKPWKRKKFKRSKHGRHGDWGHPGYGPPPGTGPYPGHFGHRSRSLKGLVVDAVLRRLARRG